MNGNVLLRINARVRSGRVAANTMAAGPPSTRAKRTAFPKPAASMTASISPARSSSVRTCGTGSDQITDVEIPEVEEAYLNRAKKM
jgi:hypothetical protein